MLQKVGRFFENLKISATSSLISVNENSSEVLNIVRIYYFLVLQKKTGMYTSKHVNPTNFELGPRSINGL